VPSDDLAVGVFADHVVEEESWVMMVSPSMPITSVMWVMRRDRRAGERPG